MGWDFRGEEEPVTERQDRREFKEEIKFLEWSFNKTEFGKGRSPEETEER